MVDKGCVLNSEFKLYLYGIEINELQPEKQNQHQFKLYLYGIEIDT